MRCFTIQVYLLLIFCTGSSGQTVYKTYQNDFYGISFLYPENYIIEEQFDYLEASDNVTIARCGDEFSIRVFNPKRKKEVYDCCYTPEEIELYGEIPSIDIQIKKLDCLKYKYEISPNVKKVMEKLTELGFDSVQIKNSTLFIPRGRTRDLRYDSKTGKKIDVWKLVDRCDTCRVLSENEVIIKCTACPEGVEQNTIAIVVCDGEYAVQISDTDTEYPEDVDKLIKSIVIRKPIKKIDLNDERIYKNFRKYGFASKKDLFEEELQSFSNQELRIMREEIYASHGYIFKSQDLMDYFSQKDWYEPKTSDIELIILSDTEKKNIELFLKLENKK